MAWLEVRKIRLGDDRWTWSCGVCHYGMNVPWETCRYWWQAMAQVQTHIIEHRAVGKREEWIPLL